MKTYGRYINDIGDGFREAQVGFVRKEINRSGSLHNADC